MGVYDSQIATALRLITAKGKSVNLVRVGILTDPDQPWKYSGIAMPAEVMRAVFLNFSIEELETMSEMPGAGEVSVSDRKLLAAASGLSGPPKVSDQVQDYDGKNWSIAWVQTLSLNGEDIIHTLRVRR